MAEILKREKQLNWACRIAITVDVIIILSGYFSWFQTKHQLVSPLIPRSTAYEIFNDTGESFFKASICATILFLLGLWFYSFNKKTVALILFIASMVSYKVFLYFYFSLL